MVGNWGKDFAKERRGCVAPNATPGKLLPASTAGRDCDGDEDEGLI